MALTSSVSRAVEIIVSLKDKITAPAKKIANSFKNIGKNADKNFKKVDKEAKKATTSVKKLTSSVGSLLGKLAGLASGITVGAIINIASRFEQLSISLRTVTGDAEEASEQFEKIREFAATVPLGVGELTQAFIKLQSRGLEPSIEALEAYGNTAAALGKTLDQFVEAVADAATFQFERLREFGIVARQDATSVAFTFQGATTTVGKSAQEIEGYLRDLGQNQFAGGLVAQMDTIAGATSNLGDAFNALAVSIGQAGLSDTVKTIYGGLADFLKQTTEGIKNNAAEIKTTLDFIGNAFIVTANAIKVAWNTVGVAVDKVQEGIARGAAKVFDLLGAVSFGDTAKEFDLAATAFEKTADRFATSAEQNTKDMAVAFARMAELNQEGIGTDDSAAQKAKEDAEQLKAAYDRLGITQLNVDPVLNTQVYEEQLRQIQSQPVTVPIQFVPANNPNDVIYNEMVQRGDNG